MRKSAALLLLLGFAWPAMAAKTISIAAMEQLLDTLHGQPDGKIAAELDDVRLTQRVSQARLALWDADFPGPKTHEALMKLADLSAFLSPPPADVPRDPPPAIEAQKQMLRMAVQYVRTVISRLPDFYATRVTAHFTDTLRQFGGHWLGEGTTALHPSGVYSRTVTYRGGREVPFSASGKREEQPALGLTTSGEFGPVLAQVLVDALEGGIRFLRWEQHGTGLAAVFAYTVPASASHFPVAMTIGNQVERMLPAYHGEIAIDPATGAILRLSEIADMTPPHQAMRAAIEVNYAPVTIAGRSYILPVRSVAFSKIPVATYSQGPPGVGMTRMQTETDPNSWPVQTDLNDVAFIDYHQFRATVQIVPNRSGKEKSTNPAAPAGVPQS